MQWEKRGSGCLHWVGSAQSQAWKETKLDRYQNQKQEKKEKKEKEEEKIWGPRLNKYYLHNFTNKNSVFKKLILNQKHIFCSISSY